MDELVRRFKGNELQFFAPSILKEFSEYWVLAYGTLSMSLSADLRFLPCMSTDLKNMLEMYSDVLLLIAFYIITQEWYFTHTRNGKKVKR